MLLMVNDLEFSDPFEGYAEQMTVADVAEALRLTDKAVTAQARAGQIPGAFKLGTGPRARWRFNRTMLANWYRQQMEDSLQRYREQAQGTQKAGQPAGHLRPSHASRLRRGS